jgi:hypothetical protein
MPLQAINSFFFLFEASARQVMGVIQAGMPESHGVVLQGAT